MRLRTTKTKSCLSHMTALTMAFKPCQSAGKTWRRLDGSHQIADIIQGVKFKDGEPGGGTPAALCLSGSQSTLVGRVQCNGRRSLRFSM